MPRVGDDGVHERDHPPAPIHPDRDLTLSLAEDIDLLTARLLNHLSNGCKTSPYAKPITAPLVIPQGPAVTNLANLDKKTIDP